MKLVRFAIVFICVLFLLTACAPAVQGLAQLPDEGVQLVFFLVTAGLTWALLKLSEVTGIDLKGYAGPIAAILAPIIVTFIEAGLQQIPPIFDNLVLSIIHLLVLLLGSLGSFLAYALIKKPKNFTLR